MRCITVFRPISALLAALLLATVVTACMGDDDDDLTATATSGAAATPTVTSSATPTATIAPLGSDAASPTTDPSAPASPQATAPSRPIGTPTSPSRTTETPTSSTVTEDEATLLTALIQPEDLAGDWIQDAIGPMELDTDDDDELCGQPPFPDRDQRLAGVEAEYSRDTADPAFVLHNIVAFPEETAVAAMAYVREITTCGQWTDADGQAYTIAPLAEPELGDDAYAAVMTFEIQGTPFYSESTFIRIGGLIATVAFITIEGSEVADLQGLPALAADRLNEIAGSFATIDPQDALLRLVLLPEDVALVDDDNDWMEDGLTDTDDPERYGFCNAESFPDALGSLGEVGREMSADPDDGPFLLHSVAQLAEGDGAVAMEWIRDELSCASWSDDDAEYQVVDSGDLDVGDDTYWLIVAATDGETTAQISLGFTQIGDIISVVGMAQMEAIDPTLFGAIMALGAEKVLARMET